MGKILCLSVIKDDCVSDAPENSLTKEASHDMDKIAR